MKILINNRNLVTWPSRMAEILTKQNHEVEFIDNGSTYEPLLQYYKHCGHMVHYLPNLGKDAGWQAGICQRETAPYVYTDPDYDLSMIPEDWDEKLIEGLDRLSTIKCGLSLDETAVPPENPAYGLDQMGLDVEQHSFARWGNRVQLGHGFLNVPCDTSFAVYRPGSGFTIGGIRADRPYTAVHVPWHLVLEEGKDPGKRYEVFNDEWLFYFDHVENSSYSHGRLVPIIEEYRKRRLS